ncbi:NfeD family protein [Spiribacter vilamensis]|nr:nodulation protein NfeD [Spiribacter vilamensis]
MRALLLILLALFAATASAESIHRLTIDGTIGPATASYVIDGLETAEAESASAVVLSIDTPGGLDTAMRDIVQAILDSSIPVLGYVSSSGARAASAGTYILYATHWAAMAPGTNLGAATPVRIGGSSDSGDETDSEPSTMERKRVNDAVAYIRSLAELRGRNAEWAERAVRESVSLSAEAALADNVIDQVASDLRAVLDAAPVESDGLAVEDRPPGWSDEFLAAITNPNITYILLLVGLYGLIFELANPGAIVPGVIGGTSLLLALFAIQVLPVNYAGLALIALGVVFMVGEALMPSFGALGVGGVLVFGLGSVLLFDTQGPGFELSLLLVAGVSAASFVIFAGTGWLAIRAFRRRGVAGTAHMQGAVGEVIATDPHLRVRVEGERWRAVCTQTLQTGDRIRVTNINGLTVTVEPTGSKGEES